MQFDGPCPFATCLETGPHTHEICPACGAVRHGNLFCPECRKHMRETQAIPAGGFTDQILTMLDERDAKEDADHA